jgi:hypothetical protein
MSQKTLHRNVSRHWLKWGVVFSLFAILGAFYGVQHLEGQQTFNSGSTGADGPLTFTTPGTYTFDPKALNIDPEGDNVFNFTTITIGSGVTLKLTSKVVTGGLYWLASGDVLNNGTIDLSGEDGPPILGTTQSSLRIPAAAGPGGYSGGLGGITGGSPAQAGNGPGGGAGATTTATRGGDGTFNGNQFLTPLVGGSGGGGGLGTVSQFGGGGGAGGGALLIASSTRITCNSCNILADGGFFSNAGNGQGGGAGAGGAIRLVAPAIGGNGVGSIYARGAKGSLSSSNGIIRLEGFSVGGFNDQRPTAIVSTPLGIILPSTPPPSLKVTSINGVSINANPFSFPDTTVNSSSPIVVSIEAHYIPLGTIPKVIVFSEVGPDQVVNASALTGTLAVSTATASITFPTGGSRGYVKATW